MRGEVRGGMIARRIGQAKALVGLVLLAGILMPVPSAEAACGEFYRIKRGDTLRTISVQELGTEDYLPLFEANRDILRNPSRIEVGQLLYLPCEGPGALNRKAALDAAGVRPSIRDDIGDRQARREGETIPPGSEDAVPPPPASVAATPAAPTAAETKVEVLSEAAAVQVAPPDDGTLRVLTGSGLAPLAGKELPANGMAALILTEALAAGDETREMELAFVDDWKSHLPVLMPTGAYSLGLPWPKPDCSAEDRSTLSRKLCEDFVFSQSLYEIQISLVVPADSPLALARSDDELRDRRLCRPASFPPVDLEQMQTPVEVVTAEDAAGCARKLVAGEVDAISLPQPAAKRLLADPAFTEPLVIARYLGSSVPVHAVAWRATPGSQDLIDKLDTGLESLQASGRWLAIVSAYLRELREAAPSQ